MPVIKGLEWTFDTVAERYAKIRPNYPDKLYEDIFKMIAINADSRVLEVGIGTGQATSPILKTGCKLIAVEHGKDLSKLCSERFKNYPNFSVNNNKFEDFYYEDNSYDLIYSATAFHWIDERVGYKKVYDLLKSGGVFARFANHPYSDKGNPDLAKEINKIYKAYYYHYYNEKQKELKEFSEKDASNLSNIAKKHGFVDTSYKLYSRTRTFTATEYITLLGTYSDHIAIDKKIKTKFFNEIKIAINNFGGSITIYDTIDLQLARKPELHAMSSLLC